MNRAHLLQEIRIMRFEEAYTGWLERRLTQEDAASLLGVCERSFRRYVDRFEDAGMEGLIDKRIGEVSHRKAPVDEVLRLEALYRERYDSWNVAHFYERYREHHRGDRSYTWVKNRLQGAGLVDRGRRQGRHRKQRPRKPMIGMMIHQDGSTHEWVPGQVWDLIVTLDDATGAVYSGFFVDEEGTRSSFRGLRETIEQQGLFSSFYSDRGSHYWFTPKAGGKVDRSQLTQFGRALKQLGIEMIAAYSPQARGRSERPFRTLQDRLVKELAEAGITDMAAANAFLTTYWPKYNQRFAVQPRESGSAFVPLLDIGLANILCIQVERTVGADNCVSYQGITLQIAEQKHRCHFIKVKVRVHAYPNGQLAIFHGPRMLGQYEADGTLIETTNKTRRKKVAA